MTAQPTVYYKGFDKDLKCRGFQYEVGKTYEHDGHVEICASGFHACPFPLDVFGYYEPASSRFSVVSLEGVQGDSDDKVCAAKIAIEAELSLPDFIGRAVDWIIEKAKSKTSETGYWSAATNTGNQSAATNTGYWSAATNTGYQSAATNTGYRSAATNTGDRSAATNTGYWSAATNTGYQSAATNTGYRSAATNTGNRSAATNTGDRSAATNTGDRSAATNTGNRSAATNTGDRSAATVKGADAVAVVTGYRSKACASEGSAIMLVERDDDMKITAVFAGIAGQDGIKPDTFYTLTDGVPVEATS